MPLVAAKVSSLDELKQATENGYKHVCLDVGLVGNFAPESGVFSSCTVASAAELKGQVDLCCLSISPAEEDAGVQSKWAEMEALIADKKCSVLGIANASEQQIVALLAIC